jgi:hypothetical protein
LRAPQFDDKGQFKLIGYDGNTYHLTRITWELKIKRPERDTLRFNFDKIELTITHPDEVRKSRTRATSKILYRKFDRINIRENITAPWDGYYAVVIDSKRNRIQTIYPTQKIKRE